MLGHRLTCGQRLFGEGQHRERLLAANAWKPCRLAPGYGRMSGGNDVGR
jgi:hypothetical protein